MENLPATRKNDAITTDNIFGPDMRKLPMRERIFVCLMFEGARNQTDAATKAGFGPYTNPGSMRVKACQLMQKPDIKAAFIEESRRRNVLMLPSLEKALRAMVDNPQHADHFKAVKLGFDHAGVALARELNVNVSITKTEDEKIAQMREWAVEMNRKGMNIDVSKLLGASTEKPIQDAEFSDVLDPELEALR